MLTYLHACHIPSPNVSHTVKPTNTNMHHLHTGSPERYHTIHSRPSRLDSILHQSRLSFKLSPWKEILESVVIPVKKRRSCNPVPSYPSFSTPAPSTHSGVGTLHDHRQVKNLTTHPALASQPPKLSNHRSDPPRKLRTVDTWTSGFRATILILYRGK
ncbi:hypothetical protein BJ165DRAFT_983433 [Panaeolus papilionaceus]|nr:hypothetical protein BJ165DRAFT_983433 [Panaeolus papilionaceus]